MKKRKKVLKKEGRTEAKDNDKILNEGEKEEIKKQVQKGDTWKRKQKRRH